MKYSTWKRIGHIYYRYTPTYGTPVIYMYSYNLISPLQSKNARFIYKIEINECFIHIKCTKVINYYIINSIFSFSIVNCRLPDAWSGRWFQSGIANAVLIDNKSIEGKGTCYESSGDKFLFVEK
jgi:hypothetical protein